MKKHYSEIRQKLEQKLARALLVRQTQATKL